MLISLFVAAMPDSKSIKSGVLVFLIVALMWRIKTSFNKLIFSDEVTIYRTLDVNRVAFPSVTICLVPNQTADQESDPPVTFKEIHSSVLPLSEAVLAAEQSTLSRKK